VGGVSLPSPIGPHTNRRSQAKKIKSQCERAPQDKVEIEYDPFAEFDVCAGSHTPLYGGADRATCPFDGALYHASFKGSICTVCEVATIGGVGSGLRLFAPLS
jgi:coatomer subunit alpha